MKLALIPARAGSERIKNKNVKPLFNKPLLKYSIEAAMLMELDQVWVSSDDPNYLEMAKKAGALPLLRSKAIAGKNSTDLEVVQHFINLGELELDDIIIYLRPTTPLRKQAMLKTGLSLFDSFNTTKMVTSMRSVEPMPESAYKCLQEAGAPYLRGICGGTVEEAGKPNHQYPQTLKANGYLDIIKVSTVMDGSLWGEYCLSFVTEPVIELDTPSEWHELETQLIKEGHPYVY